LQFWTVIDNLALRRTGAEILMFPKRIRLAASSALILFFAVTAANADILAQDNRWSGEESPAADNSKSSALLAPLPPAGILFVSALAGLGLLGRRRRAKNNGSSQDQ
jgi:hypothetical protein